MQGQILAQAVGRGRGPDHLQPEQCPFYLLCNYLSLCSIFWKVLVQTISVFPVPDTEHVYNWVGPRRSTQEELEQKMKGLACGRDQASAKRAGN